METVLVVVHLLLAIGLVGLILIQHGKGADMGAAFGSGASATVFGASGAGNFLSRTTGILATLFFITSLALAYFAMNTGEQTSVVDAAAIEQAAPQAESEIPAIPEAESAEVPVVTDEVPVLSDEVPAVPEAPVEGGDVPQIPN